MMKKKTKKQQQLKKMKKKEKKTLLTHKDNSSFFYNNPKIKIGIYLTGLLGISLIAIAVFFPFDEGGQLYNGNSNGKTIYKQTTTTTLNNEISSRVSKGDLVLFSYTGKLEDGGIAEQVNDLKQRVGVNLIMPGIEEALIGMKKGEEKTVIIPPEKAYGEWDPKKVTIIPKIQSIKRNQKIPIDDFVKGLNKEPKIGMTIGWRGLPWGVEVVNISSDEGNVTVDLAPPKSETDKYKKIQGVIGFLNVNVTPEKIILEVVSVPKEGSIIKTGWGNAKVLNVYENDIKLDFNNPLAGKILTYTLKVDDITKGL